MLYFLREAFDRGGPPLSPALFPSSPLYHRICGDTPHYKVFGSIPWVDARFFTAAGGLCADYATRNRRPGLNCSFGSGNKDRSRQNRALVAKYFGVTSSQLLTTTESTTSVLTVTKAWNAEGRPPDNALVMSRFYDHVLGMLTRDCAPVLFADKRNPIAANVHVGWELAAEGLLEKAVTRMEELGSKRANIAAAIGPCAGVVDSYNLNNNALVERPRLDPDIKLFFREVLDPSSGKVQTVFRFQEYLAHRLEKAEIRDITRIAVDTITDRDCYSYRSDVSGLMFSGIMLKRNF